MKNKDLLNEVNDEKNKNRELLNELLSERKKNVDISTDRKRVEELNNQIIIFEKSSYENAKKIKELQKLLNDKNNELKDLKSRIPNSKPIIKQGEKIIIVNFESINKDIQFPLTCKNTDIIARVEERFYNEYPKYKEQNTYLTVNGNVIKRFQSMDENGIKNGNSIIVNIYQ